MLFACGNFTTLAKFELYQISINVYMGLAIELYIPGSVDF